MQCMNDTTLVAVAAPYWRSGTDQVEDSSASLVRGGLFFRCNEVGDRIIEKWDWGIVHLARSVLTK